MRRVTTPRASHPAGRAFTLIELLVVIGIIALLLGILLPSLLRARARAEAVKCASNLQQCLQASAAYCGESKGFFPYAHYVQDVGGQSFVSGAPVTLKPYYSSPDVIRCPTDPEAMDLHVIYRAILGGSSIQLSPELPQFTSYQMNYYVFVNGLNGDQPRQRNQGSLRYGSDLIVLFDGAVGREAKGWWELVQARHPGPSFNAGFLDGHVESIAAEDRGTTLSLGGSAKKYFVRGPGNRPIYHAGSNTIPPEAGVAVGGQDPPAYGAVVYGPVLRQHGP
jgi:prepilin-type N-terminal cleavage/methylation domain-containing protein/prepilin-type processing-associated H-X9-DG protein